jgi:hypothetical protein
MPVFTIAVQSAVGREVRGVATSSTQFFRAMGGTMGVSIMGAIMAAKMASGLTDVSKTLTEVPAATLNKFSNPQLLLSANTRASMPPPVFHAVQKVLAHSIDWIFITGVIFVFIGVIAAFFLGNSRLKKSETDASEGNKEKLKVEMDMV